MADKGHTSMLSLSRQPVFHSQHQSLGEYGHFSQCAYFCLITSLERIKHKQAYTESWQKMIRTENSSRSRSSAHWLSAEFDLFNKNERNEIISRR